MQNVNILIFPCGSEVGLELHRALKDVKFITLFGASGADDHGRFVFRNYIGNVPFIDDPSFLSEFNRIIDENNIDFIFPALDSVIEALCKVREKLHAKLLTCPNDSALICRNKVKTYSRLSGCNFLPEIYNSVDDIKTYPVIIKPTESQGSQGFKIIDSKDELLRELTERKDQQVICEYLPGEEYTVDCFTDRHGVLRFVSIRNRERIRNGISVRSSLIETDDEIRNIAEIINSKMELRGVWFFQVKRNKAEQYRLLECATRIAGTMCLERGAGINLALLTVFDALDFDLEIEPLLPTAQVDRALYNTFRIDIDYDEVYVDFDDTLIIHGKVNRTLLSFLYQCVEQNKKIILLTRHNIDPLKDLISYRISPELFDKIIWVPFSEQKKDYITPSKKALFIDDSFAERKAMRERFSLTALGVDAVEALLDERQ